MAMTAPMGRAHGCERQSGPCPRKGCCLGCRHGLWVGQDLSVSIHSGDAYRRGGDGDVNIPRRPEAVSSASPGPTHTNQHDSIH
ncbi:uncharacterized protein SPSK_10724 [Sporothrix schenckii 1099-18]|uniref:Uncharacterized protein n=1 Tax=Sporothrix schenckii 1099-18 TaxID=1397361 RepID=A0A0F2MK86_SPOSC|nr:uncharacterized protein SPSK_10724 [Sporothrix schenckii 1099-18]KJR89255.1 hypothetical protein SPSK_10724 [Sporothrix schenckii 1099-18]